MTIFKINISKSLIIAFLFLFGINFILTIDVFADNELPSEKVEDILVRAINWLAGIIATVSVLIVIAGGLIWMTAGGEEDRAKSSRKWIIAGLGGLALSLSAFILVNIVIGFFN